MGKKNSADAAVERQPLNKEKKARTQNTEMKSIRPLYLGIAAIMIIVVVIYLVSTRSGSETVSSEDILSGRQYILNLEGKDVTAITEKINTIKKRKLREALEDGDVSVWSMFYDYLIMGDSRAVGFWFYELLEESRCLTAAGSTIHDVPDQIDQVKAINASNIFLCYGVNDVSIGFYPTPEEYAQAMDETVRMLQEACPNATIYINSILPCQEIAFQQSEKWREIPDYNRAVKAMAEEKGYHYIDNTDVAEVHANLYDIDGIHLMKPFYDYWASNILVEMSQ